MAEELQDVLEKIDSLIEDGEAEEAEGVVNAALESFGKAPELVVAQAEIAVELEEFENAVATCDESVDAIEDDELKGRLLAAKGYALYYQDEMDAARMAFNDAVRACPTLVTAIVGRAIVHEEMNFYTAALLDLDRSIELDDQEAQPFAVRGSIFIRFGHVDKGTEDLKAAVAIDPDDEESTLNLARIHALKRETSDAMQYLETLCSNGEDPDFVAPALLLRAQLSLTLGSFEAGLEDSMKAIELVPELPFAYLQAAACVLTGGAEPGKAVDLLKKAEDSVGDIRDLPDIFALRAAAYDQLGKADKAQEWRNKAEGVARLPGYVYGPLNPANNLPVNPAKPIDIRQLLDDLFGGASNAPQGYEDLLRQIVDKIPEIVKQNPNVGQLQIELPEAPGMVGGKRQLVVQVNNQQQQAQQGQQPPQGA